MIRRRLTAETLDSQQQTQEAEQAVIMAGTLLGPAASDDEVIRTAKVLRKLPASELRNILATRKNIQSETRRFAAGSPDGAADLLEETGPTQPDPTNTQALVKGIMTTPDHAVLDSLQKKSVHAPTASRRRMAEETTPDLDDLGEDDDLDDLDDLEDDTDDLGDEGDLGEDDDLDDDDAEDDDSLDLDQEDEDLTAMMEDADDGEDEDPVMFGEEGEEDHEEPDGDEGEDEDLDSLENDSDEPEMLDEEELDDDLGDDEAEDHVDPTASRSARRGRGRVSSGSLDLDEILSLGESDFEERVAGSRSDSDEAYGALIASKVKPSHTGGYAPGIDVSSRSEGFTWFNENEDKGKPQRQSRKASAKKPGKVQPAPAQAPAKKRTAAKQNNFTPDRRRVTARRNDDNFDAVFGVPDVGSFFDS